jgi:hypothetical protein
MRPEQDAGKLVKALEYLEAEQMDLSLLRSLHQGDDETFSDATATAASSLIAYIESRTSPTINDFCMLQPNTGARIGISKALWQRHLIGLASPPDKYRWLKKRHVSLT